MSEQRNKKQLKLDPLKDNSIRQTNRHQKAFFTPKETFNGFIESPKSHLNQLKDRNISKKEKQENNNYQSNSN